MITSIVRLCLKNFRIFAAATLGISQLTAFAYTTDYYSPKSQLAQGRWVKVKVNSSGIAQLTPQTLRDCGFDDPSRVAVYGYGGTRLTKNSFDADLPDDLKPTAVYHCPDGRILFYAEADYSVNAATAKTINIRRNYYDHNAYYFITSADNSTDEFVPLTEKPDATPVETHMSVSFVEHEIQNPGKGGAIFHDQRIYPGQEIGYDLEIRDFTPDDGCSVATLLYNYAIYNSKSTALEFEFPQEIKISTIHHSPAGTQTQDTKLYANGKSSANITEAADGIHSFKFHLPDGAEPRYAALDWVAVVYPRLNHMTGSWLDMSFLSANKGDRIDITNAKKSTLVWDITDAAHVSACPTYFDELNSTVSTLVEKSSKSSAIRLMAFDTEAQYPSAEICGEISNQNLHGAPVPNMVIITTAELLGPARQLADIHQRYDGLSVAVIDQQEIFNEFSSGTRTAMAYRRYLKMLYDREPQTIKHVLLYGTGWWDNRSDIAADKLVCYEAENPDHSRDVTKNYTSDKYFVMLENDFNASRLHFGIMSLPIGRLAIENEAQGYLVNDKIERYITHGRGHDVYGDILVLSDDGDSQGHFLDSEKAIAGMSELNPTLTFTRAHNLIYPFVDGAAMAGRKTISHALTSGQGMMLYCGHCSQDAFTGERLFDKKLISSVKYDDFPFAMLATCETFGFDRFNNLVGNALINANHGGAIALIGACRQVYMEYNRAFAIAVSKAYAEAKHATTIGEISQNAHNYCIRNYSENDRAVNNLCFNLYGDPALKVYAPKDRITIDDINGLAPTDNGTIPVKVLKPFTISGHVTGSSFDGEAVIRVFDRPYEVQTNERTLYEDQTKKYTVTLDENVIATQKVKVTGGRFTANLTLPGVTDGNNNLCRLTVSATADDNSASAAYVASILDVSAEPDPADIDNSAPVISDFYLNDKNFVTGDVLGSDITVYALIELPASGIKLNGMFKDGLSLRLDGRTTYDLAADALKLNSDGTASLTMPISDLTDGTHDLTLTVKSNADISVSKTIDFKVCNTNINSSIVISDKPVRNSLVIDINHEFSSEPTARLIIEDHLGNTVFSAETNSFPYEWNLCDNDGNEVPDGNYRISALLHDDISHSATSKLEFVVVR